MILALLLAAATPNATPAPKAGIRIENVRIRGRRYKVEVKGRRVWVTYKAMIARFDADTISDMRQAVATATGCQIVDTTREAVTMYGTLNCDAGPARP
jgi:hypothetical protein